MGKVTKIRKNVQVGYTLPELYKDYRMMKQAMNVAPATLANYDRTFDMFNDYLGDRNTTEDITVGTIYSYINSLQDRMVKATSINHYLRDLRAFLYWCMKQDYFPQFDIKLIKEGEAIKETYTDKELEAMLQKPRENDTFVDWRTWVIINYTMATGNRAETICSLKIGDIDFTKNEVRLEHTKNRKQQILPLGRELPIILKKYLNEWRSEATPDEYLFANIANEKLTVNGLRLALKRYNKTRGVDKSSVHALRHTFAKKWILNTGDVFRLQKILGHSTLDMTRKYVNMFSDDLKDNFENYNPLDRMKTPNSRKQTINKTR